MAQKNEVPIEIKIAASAAQQVQDRKAAEQREAEAATVSTAQAATVLSMLNTNGLPATSAANDLQQQVLATLLASLQRDLAKKDAKDEKEANEIKQLMLARADSLRLEKAQRENTQRVCDHRKENGHSRICGQRLSNGNLALLCNLCYKEFDQNSCPPHLMIPSEFIGG